MSKKSKPKLTEPVKAMVCHASDFHKSHKKTDPNWCAFTWWVEKSYCEPCMIVPMKLWRAMTRARKVRGK